MASIMRQISTIHRCAFQFRTIKSSHELPGVYSSYIMTICNHPGFSQEKIARHICLSKSSVTRHLSFLEKNGYIRRETSADDKRELLVFPTDKMLNIYEETLNTIREWNSMVFDGIDTEELNSFFNTLEKMSLNAVRTIYREDETP